MKEKADNFNKILVRDRDSVLSETQKVFQGWAIEAHMLGSVARGDSDPYSDLDVWFTFKDEDIQKTLSRRLESYVRVEEVIHVCEPPQNAPEGGIHSFVLYKTSGGLLEVDYYLCPQSKSFKTKDSKTLFGSINLPLGELGFNQHKAIVGSDYRIDFVIMLAFISIKNLVRNEEDALKALFLEYGYLSERYGITILPLQDTENTFSALKRIILNLGKTSNERQRKALSEITTFLDQAESFKSPHTNL